MPRRAKLTAQQSQDLEILGREIELRRMGFRVPRHVREVMSRHLSRRGYAQIQAVTELQAFWRSVVGPEWAEDSRPGTLRRGVLEVLVRNSTVLQELTFRKHQLLRQLAENEQGVEFKNLRFRVGEMATEQT
ncbi:MAG: hypothetical protein CMJ75_00090 [Planctomycetaceae bacterium]|nr:hypothetical protein [Planctomycetaceae bacterium]